jgi:hypothetical protein
VDQNHHRIEVVTVVLWRSFSESQLPLFRVGKGCTRDKEVFRCPVPDMVPKCHGEGAMEEDMGACFQCS